MTRYEASIDKNWEELGIANVLVSRRHEDGFADIAVFLIDAFCLGVTNVVFMPDMSADEEHGFLADGLQAETREAIYPACAKKLIEGAAAYGNPRPSIRSRLHNRGWPRRCTPRHDSV